MGLRHVLALGS